MELATYRTVTSEHRTSQGALLAAGILLSLSAMVLLSEPSRVGLAVVAGVCGLAAVGWSVAYTTRHRGWLIFALLLIELFASVSFVNDTALTMAHYALIACFTLPVLPGVFRTGVWRQGGFRLFAVYLVWALITVSYSQAPLYSFARLVSTAMLVGALIAVTAEVQSADDVMKLITAFLAGCGVVLVLTALGSVALPKDLVWRADGDPEVGGGLIPRYSGLFLSPNQVGMLMLTTVGPALLCLPASRGWKRLAILLAIAAATASAVLADSRTSVVAIVTGCILYVIWRYRWRGALVCLACAGAIAFAAMTAGPHLSGYANRGDVTTLTGRTLIWQFAIRSIKDRVLLGYGYEAGGMIFQSRYFPLWWGPWDQGPRSSLHNNYLAHAVEVGVPATLFWLFIILRPWVSLLHRDDDPWKLKPVLFLITIPILVLGLGESTAGDCRYSVGLLFMMVWAIAERARMIADQNELAQRREALAKAPRAVAALLVALAAIVVVTASSASAGDYHVNSAHGLDSNSNA